MMNRRKDIIMNKLEMLRQVCDDISYDINGIWDNSILDENVTFDMIKKILDKLNDKELKDNFIDIIKYYVFRMYEEMRNINDNTN